MNVVSTNKNYVLVVELFIILMVYLLKPYMPKTQFTLKIIAYFLVLSTLY